METNKGIETFHAKTRKQWRAWLQKHSGATAEVYLILYNKNSEMPCLSYDEAVEEALCFGWIDSLTNKRDAESRYQRFSPRKPGSNWSQRNKDRVQKLIESGLMTAPGHEMISIAKEKGKW